MAFRGEVHGNREGREGQDGCLLRQQEEAALMVSMALDGVERGRHRRNMEAARYVDNVIPYAVEGGTDTKRGDNGATGHGNSAAGSAAVGDKGPSTRDHVLDGDAGLALLYPESRFVQ